MLFLRSEVSGIPQNSVIVGCSSTTLASRSAASPMIPFLPTLCVTEARKWALTQKRTLLGGGALEGGDLRLLEDASECRGAFVSDVVVKETAKHGRGWGVERAQPCQGALTERRTLGSWFERRAVYSSNCSVELPLGPLAKRLQSMWERLRR